MHVLRTVLALTLVVSPVAAQHVGPDTVVRKRVPAKRIIRPWQAGAIVGLTGGAMLIDQSVRNSLHRDSAIARSALVKFGNALGTPLYVAPVLAVGMVAGQAFGSKRLLGISWRALESALFAGGTAAVLKSVIGRRRPNVEPEDPFEFGPFTFKDNSFPSGHTVVAFALANSFAGETRDHWSDVIFYGLASVTAYSRIKDDKHWLSDTVFGAGVGIVAARVVQRLHRPFVVTPRGVALSLTF